jgi:hypothetical protein
MSLKYEQPVYRFRHLPTGNLIGTFFVTQAVIDATRNAVISFEQSGIEDGGHEGLAYWCGREAAGSTVFLHVVVPETDHGPGHVSASKSAIGLAARHARRLQLGLLCQIHSHPGDDARHSDGDDELILLPFEGMLSVVVPHFGRGFRTITDACVHQYRTGRWVLCSRTSVQAHFVVIPAMEDLR